MVTENIFKAIFIGLLIFLNLVRIYYHLCYKSKKVLSLNKIKETSTVIIFYISFLIPAILYVLTNYLEFFSLQLNNLLRFLGIIIILFGTYLFWWTHQTLGKNFSAILEIKKSHKLIKSGPYKRIRHPMYTSLYIIILGFFLLSSNIFIGLFPFIGFSILYITRIKKEETMMIKTFGDEYKEYMKTTGKLFPKFF